MNSLKRMILCMVSLSMLIFMVAISPITARADETRYGAHTTINGYDVSGKTVAEATGMIQDILNSYSITIYERNNKTETIAASDFGYTGSVSADSMQALLGRGDNVTLGVPITVQYDEAALIAKIDSLGCMSGSGIVATQNAHISDYQEGKSRTIIPEVQGNDVDRDAFIQAVKDAIAGGQKGVNLTDRGCYKTVTITKNDPKLKEILKQVNNIDDITITLTIGDASEVLLGSSLSSWIKGSTADGQVDVDADAVANYIQSLSVKYNTAGMLRNFTTHDGRVVQLSGKYGWAMNNQAEVDNLIAMIRSGQSQTHDVGKPKSDFEGNYVEVDLAAQHVYFFSAGALVWESPCVTGKTSDGHTTPEGIYTIYSKETNRILRGQPDANGKPKYESHVNYWMPFNGGIGLHDASWRSNFGGTIYQNSGSHGCVNLPTSKAPELFGLVTVGTPVVCHN